MKGRGLALLLSGTLALVIGCGSNSTMATGGNPPAQPSPSPSPTPTPPPGSAQWSSNVTGATGTVTVSTAGDVTIQVTGAQASTTYVGNFCQYPGSTFSSRGLNPCFLLNQSLTTDAGGSAQLSFHFPRSGAWTGAFNFAPGGDTNSPSRITTDNIGTQGTLTAVLVPLSKANNGGAPGAMPSVQEPGSGSVSLKNANVTVTLNGATANASFIVVEAFSDGGSATQQIGTLNTDATGTATASFAVLSSSGSIFDIERVENPMGSTATGVRLHGSIASGA